MTLDDRSIAALRRWEDAAVALQRDLVQTGAAHSLRVHLIGSGLEPSAHVHPARVRFYVDELLGYDEFELDVGSTEEALYQLARSAQDLIADVYRNIWPSCEAHRSFFDVIETSDGPVWRCHHIKQHEFAVGRFS